MSHETAAKADSDPRSVTLSTVKGMSSEPRGVANVWCVSGV